MLDAENVLSLNFMLQTFIHRASPTFYVYIILTQNYAISIIFENTKYFPFCRINNADFIFLFHLSPKN